MARVNTRQRLIENSTYVEKNKIAAKVNSKRRLDTDENYRTKRKKP